METRKPILTEQEFVDFRTGCPLAFRTIFDVYHKSLYRYVFGITQNEFEAEETVQEGFIQLFAHRGKIENSTAIYPYLFTIIKRLVVVSFRKKLVQARYDQHLSLQWKESSSRTEEEIAEKELAQLLEDMIKTLPEKQRNVYTLHSVNGFTYDEIALELGSSRHTIKNQVVEASKKIKKQLRKHYYLWNMLGLIFSIYII